MGSDYDKDTSSAVMVKLPGIAGLKLPVAAKFIVALKLEEKGEHAEAYSKLEEAVSLEGKNG